MNDLSFSFKRILIGVLVLWLGLCTCMGTVLANDPAENPLQGGPIYFKIKVVDEDTGRGVPLVELRTVNEIRYYTDSNGIVAFHEPGLMNQKVFFHIKSHGYEFRKDFFGYRGKALDVVPGGEAILKIRRINIAERLYRITGGGIYRDSVLTGEPVPIEEPLLDGNVLGQDSVLMEPYSGRLFWIWGDTNKPSYPLGQFASSGAVSELPGQDGLDPDRGVNLHYFVDAEGFSKKMAPIGQEGMVWMDALAAVPDRDGTERLVARFSRMKSLGERYEQGMVLFNDATETFEKQVNFDLDHPAVPAGHPTRVRVDGQEWIYFSSPFHFGVNLRVRALFEQMIDLDAYEILTALVDDATSDRCEIARWRKATEVREQHPQLWSTLKEKWRLVAQEIPIYEPDTGERVLCHGGTLYWNPYRQKWITIFLQRWGKTSMIGEVWYSEADTPTGPFGYGRKVLTHDAYSFYNVKHHPVFDQEDGWKIYFEGTYTHTFSGTKIPTPRYDYNQIMYRLSLDDPRLALPVPVYRTRDSRLHLGKSLESEGGWESAESVPFFAYPPGRAKSNLIPIVAVDNKNQVRLVRQAPGESSDEVLFYAIAPDDTESATPESLVVPLYEYKHRSTGEYRYETSEAVDDPNYECTPAPVCIVWKNPVEEIVLDPSAKPADK